MIICFNGNICTFESHYKALRGLALVICLLIVGSCSVRGVDITIKWFPADPEDWERLVEAECTNIPPGECCKPQQEALPSLEGIGSSLTMFSRLLANQFGAGWGATGRTHSHISDCTGLPIFRTSGPTGPFFATYQPPLMSMDLPDGEPQEIIFSASWVDLRTRLPPSTAAVRYLQFQNVRGLVWGKTHGLRIPMESLSLSEIGRRGSIHGLLVELHIYHRLGDGGIPTSIVRMRRCTRMLDTGYIKVWTEES